MHVISIVSGVPDNSLRRLVSSSIGPRLRWRKTDMDWGRLICSFSDWPSPFSSGSGICLWSAFSEDGALASSISAAPPTSPSPLVSVKRWLGRVSSASRFSVVGPSCCMGLEWGLGPASDPPCLGRFFSGIFIGMSRRSGGSSSLCYVLCDGLDFFAGNCWLAIVECLGASISVTSLCSIFL